MNDKAMEAAKAINASYDNAFPEHSVKRWAAIIRKHMPPSVPVGELRKWQDDLKIAVGETTECPTRIMLEIIIDGIDELIEANTQQPKP